MTRRDILAQRPSPDSSGASILFDMQARAGALLTAAILLAAGVFLQIPRMLLAPRDWALRGEVFEILALAAAALMVIAGACFITKRLVGPAAFALGSMFLLFVLTLHLPRVLAARRDPNQWSSALIALAMAGASWICAATAAAPSAAAPGARVRVHDGKPVPSLER